MKEEGGEEERYLRKEEDVLLWKLVEGVKNSKEKFSRPFIIAPRTEPVTSPYFFYVQCQMFYFGLGWWQRYYASYVKAKTEIKNMSNE